MEKLFGMPVTQLTLALLVAFGVGAVITGLVAIRNRVLVKAALRNIPRRRSQTLLIVLGLMLAAMLFSAALSTGDTLTHSLRLTALSQIGNVDILVRGENRDVSGHPFYFEQSQVERVRQALADDPNLEGVAPYIREQGPVVALLTRLSEARVDILGMVDGAEQGFDPLLDSQGKTLSIDRLAPGQAFVSKKVAEDLNLKVGDEIALYTGREPTRVSVTGVYVTGGVPGGEKSLVMPLAALQSLTSSQGKITAVLVTLRGDAIGGATHSDAVIAKLQPLFEGTALTVDPVKKDSLEQADLAGASVASVFLVFGQFSVMAGILLIFLIFVMLAAERKRELGIARAIGAQAGHVVRMFLFEGVAYAAIASAVGAMLGVVVGWGMVRIMAVAFGHYGFQLIHDFRPMSLVLAYLLGIMFTVAVVLISAWRVSHINVVRAIRDIPEPKTGRRSIKSFLFALALLGFGLVVSYSGVSSRQMGSYLLGTSLVTISVPLLARRVGLADRAAYTIAGGLLLFWWLMPASLNARLFPFLPDMTEMKQGIEMFFLSGIMIVAGGVWVVMYNSDLLLGALVATMGRVRGLPAILKTAVSYPMSSRFRTGMTLAMFSLVVFTLVVTAFIVKVTGDLLEDTRAVGGGYDIRATVGYANPIEDIQTALEDSDTVKLSDFEAIGSAAWMNVKMKQADTSQEYKDYYVQGVDFSYSNSVTYGMEMMAEGYDSPQEVWRALQTQPNVAVVSPGIIPTYVNYNVGGSASSVMLEGFYIEDKRLPEVYLLVQNPITGQEQRFKVIGVVSQTAFYAGGIMTSQASLAALAGQPVPPLSYVFRVKDGVDVGATARALETRFLENGIQAEVMDEEIRKSTQTNAMFNNLLQGFMGLGLVVGIAALGVIAARSVVERRQQIGVVRAIGFQKSMVQASFLLESSFVALLGIGMGVGLAMGLAVQLTDTMRGYFPGIRLSIPVLNIVIVVVIAYGASLLTTFLPARQAADVYPAEALRYE